MDSETKQSNSKWWRLRNPFRRRQPRTVVLPTTAPNVISPVIEVSLRPAPPIIIEPVVTLTLLKPDEFESKIKKISLDLQGKYLHYSDSAFWNPALLDRVIVRLIDSFQDYHASYESEPLDSIERKYYEMRLKWLQEWSTEAGYAQFINATCVVLSRLEKRPEQKNITDLQVLNLFGILYESVFAAENFYTMIELLKMQAFKPELSTEELLAFRALVKQCKAIFIDESSVEVANFSAVERAMLQRVFTDTCVSNECTDAVSVAYAAIIAKTCDLDRSTLEDLFFKQDQLYLIKSASKKSGSSSSSSAHSLVVNSGATNNGFKFLSSLRRSSSIAKEGSDDDDVSFDGSNKSPSSQSLSSHRSSSSRKKTLSMSLSTSQE